ncbi:Signal transduction histidine kinase [Clostridium cavendishii DSM 21758]|uniref:histidine kinase n=1 Tax=Clostridium cavendishii DSM 21758 TaxID=1121302 RepID=A0A1M6TXH8_9CLOT|nr:sensor histidine kinase [Clostridium cavendishii]SHK61732.1 Signal transduction histidine kinase [Clostridium cavendishii DSM 21758]
MKNNVWLFKLVIIFITLLNCLSEDICFQVCSIFLISIIFIVVIEKISNSKYILCLFLFFSLGSILYNSCFIALLSLVVFDFCVVDLNKVSLAIIVIQGVCISNKPNLYIYIALTIISIIFSRTVNSNRNKQVKYLEWLDNERKLRYELEDARRKLINTSNDIAYLTEVRERNRIAREIHDNVGHSLSGVLIKLRAAEKLQDVDREKSRLFLRDSIERLSEAVIEIRETVHNLKPKESSSISYLERIINEFKFCKVNLSLNGDFIDIGIQYLEVIISSVKEALTNVSRYSKATKVDINIDINENYIRLYIKDNGIGCQRIKEGMGLSGMRERLKQLGGSLSVSSDNGFMIVGIIPKGELGFYEKDINSR